MRPRGHGRTRAAIDLAIRGHLENGAVALLNRSGGYFGSSPRNDRGRVLALYRRCPGTTPRLHWYCAGNVLVLLSYRTSVVLVLYWYHVGSTLELHWYRTGTSVVRSVFSKIRPPREIVTITTAPSPPRISML